MKTTSTFAFFCITSALFVCISSDDLLPPDNSSACVLNFDRYTYQPSGECLSPQKRKIIYWDTISSTLCCQNALTVFSQTLALHASELRQNIFLEENQWTSCSGHFLRQESVSAHSCGFDKFFHGSSRCSNLSLSAIQQKTEFRQVTYHCSRLNSSFNVACASCTHAIGTLRDNLLQELQSKSNDTERELCGLAVIISIAATKIGDSSLVADLFSCLHSKDELDPGYSRFKNSVVKAIIAVLIAIITLILVLALIKYVAKSKVKKKSGKRKLPRPTKEITNTWSGLYRFSKHEIEDAINYGNEKKSLGRGSAGQVYKGVLPSGQLVAIKHINKSNITDSFTREVEGLSRVRHPNLVCLFGCCIEGGEQYLVYEYCPSGNLAQHLLRKDSALTWERRVKILRDCALALRYLHHYIDGCIVHRDIKLTNILLTENLEPKLSDFGLAKMLGMEESKVFTDVRGTIGYMDPEYMSNAKLTCASDIYSFGIVALQLLSGQKVFELDLDARDQLTRKAKDVSMGKRPATDFEDPRLYGNINRLDFEAILQIAVLCVAKSSKGRPTIDDVFDEMDKAWKNTMAAMKARGDQTSSSA